MTFKNTVARNIAKYRKASGLTQSELAERLNYSDKSVSKWERAEGTPDTETLVAMARLFGVTINELISEGDVPCEGAPTDSADNAERLGGAEGESGDGDRDGDRDGDGGDIVESEKGTVGEAKAVRRSQLTVTKIAITVMAVAAVWVLCGITAFLFSAIAPSVAAVWNSRIAAYFAVLSFLVWYIFAAIWWGTLWRAIFASALTWSSAAALHLSFPSENPLYICAVAAAFQVIIICAALVAKDMAKRR